MRKEYKEDEEKEEGLARRRNKLCMYICEIYALSAEKGLSQPFTGSRCILKHIEAKPIKNECHKIITFTLKI